MDEISSLKKEIEELKRQQSETHSLLLAACEQIRTLVQQVSAVEERQKWMNLRS